MPSTRRLGRYPIMDLKHAREAARAFLINPNKARVRRANAGKDEKLSISRQLLPIAARIPRLRNAALADSKMKLRLAEIGGTVLPGLSTEFGKHIADEIEKWGKVIRSANIKAQ
jgi:hypothetical protein